MVILESIIVVTMATRERINHFALTEVGLVTLLISAINCIDSLLVTSLREKIQWHIKSLSQPQDLFFLPSLGPMTPSFTPQQYQQLLALIDTPSSPLTLPVQGKEAINTTMANVVSSNATAMASMDLSHSVFSTLMVNRRAYDSNTQVIDTGSIDHIVCFVHLLTNIIAITQSIVQLPNRETALVTHIGTVTLSSSLTLQNVLCVPYFTFNLLFVSTFTKSQPYCLVFLSTFCFIQDLTFWRTIGVGHAIDGCGGPFFQLQAGLSPATLRPNGSGVGELELA